MTNQSSSEAYKSVPSAQTMERQQELSRKQAIAREQSRASLARRMRQTFNQSLAQYFMTFQDFQDPKKRNRILKGYGQEPIHLPFDPVRKKGPRTSRRRKKARSGGQ